MNNPWGKISLSDYENHMKSETVMQLQSMNEIMRDQFYRYDISDVMILGVAGGNGLNHIRENTLQKVYGIDINGDYLKCCVNRYPNLQNVFIPIEADLQDTAIILPKTGMIIANLLIEYIGFTAFQRVVQEVKPCFISCVIQANANEGFVSDTAYAQVFDCLGEVYHHIAVDELTLTMENIGYNVIFQHETKLPNRKKLIRLDYGTSLDSL